MACPIFTDDAEKLSIMSAYPLKIWPCLMRGMADATLFVKNASISNTLSSTLGHKGASEVFLLSALSF